MSRNRVGSVKASVMELEQMTSLWHSLVDTLRLLPSIPTDPSSLKASSGLSDSEREREFRVLQAERKHLDEALDKVNVLLALRRGSSLPPSGPGPGAGATDKDRDRDRDPSYHPTSTHGVSGSGSGGGGGVGPSKRKRKLSISASTSASASPAPYFPGETHQSQHQHHASATTPSSSRNLSTARDPHNHGHAHTHGNTPTSSREMTGKQRRERYFDQLPLQSGRKVAFKLPKSKEAGNNEKDRDSQIHGGGGGEDWILAVIKQCIQQDKMRYEVQDVDDGGAYNTTLRSIIPLPDPKSPAHLSSNPINLEDFPRDSQVLALYPDTTSFYRATVISPPLPGTGNGLGLPAHSKNGKNDYAGSKKGVYQLVFVDDDDKIQEVAKDMVVAYPY
ncbi:uncharacterized protein I303_105473 [Kwoniella dejecticola CBS 10117]|uniref:SGF29 C-terminal domain-containing protein n=1 Tax=Kwoniella dejecticola CBS 10117 TaxID=1296121 RepID=A0AAJ8KSQ6_9TREE